jgi:peroxiredoxin
VAKTHSNHVLKTNEKAPPIKLKGVDGKMYSLEDFNSKCALVVFICNHCPYVKACINDLINLQNSFATSELKLVGINSNDSDYQDEGFDNMVKFAEKYELNFPYLIDDTQSVARAYGATCTPDPFLFDQHKRLVFHGRINDATDPEAIPKIPIMKNNVKRVLAGKTLEKDFDPSIGCSIKWKA